MDTQNTSAGATEKDPVCGMTVDPSRAKATHEHAGKMYYFCCAGCKTKFSTDPAKYLAPKTTHWHRTHVRAPDSDCACRACRRSPADREKRGVTACRAETCLERIYVPHGSGGAPARARRLPEVRDGARTFHCRASRNKDGIHLPDASRNCARRARELPHMRNGAGAENCKYCGREKSGTRGNDQAVLGLRGAHNSDSVCGHGGYCSRTFCADEDCFTEGLAIVGICPRDACRSVGRLAVFCARLAILAYAQFEYVYADRVGNRRRVRVQRGGSAFSGRVPGGVSRIGGRSRRLF